MKPTAEAVMQAASAAGKGKGRGPAPVHLWNPPFCGDLDMVIRRDGRWDYLGTPIGRPELVRLFANILKREGEAYFLVTPVEKVGIRVEDVPFIAVDFRREDGSLIFTTNIGDETVAGPDRPIRVERDPETGESSPYVLVRADLWARIDRKSFYRLVDLGETEDDWFGLRSGGMFFPVIPSAELP